MTGTNFGLNFLQQLTILPQPQASLANAQLGKHFKALAAVPPPVLGLMSYVGSWVWFGKNALAGPTGTHSGPYQKPMAGLIVLTCKWRLSNGNTV